MPVESAADRATFFADFGTAATYRAGGTGDGTAVTVIFDRPSRRDPFLSAGMAGPGFVATVRASEVATPATGDTLTIAGTVYTVAGQPEQDLDAVLWLLPLRRNP